eukprot:TRINITY_DN7609_c0_g1_i2.p1 TRINITY_DN7609_c0_g1~~TRINITY_DN7609_c0_g1_i2.p1  ORF type:complete len:202 (-),score=32.08 TRINITY_DN7609_c0_g1_i2:348-899(-)
MGASFSGIRDYFFPRTSTILVVGLDGVGKTTLVYRMRPSQSDIVKYPRGFEIEKFTYRDMMFVTWDLGGPDRHREIWRSYLNDVRGVIFVVDSVDQERLDGGDYDRNARSELHYLLSLEPCQRAPLLVFANKQDSPHALPIAQIEQRLDLQNLNCQYFVQPTVITTSEGVEAGLEWLAHAMGL